MKALVIDRIHEDGIALLKQFCEVDVRYPLAREEFAEVIGEYDILIGRATPETGSIQAPMLERSGRLKVIGIASVGLDQFDLEYIQSKNIKLINLPGVNSISVAEHAIALLLSGIRSIVPAYQQMKNGIWNKHGFPNAMELHGKTIGIIGFGNIGKKVGQIAKHGFGMEVLAYDPYIGKSEIMEAGAQPAYFEDLLVQSDVVSIHAPLTEETYRLIGRKEILQMKKDAVLINVSRGGIIDEEALYECMAKGHLLFAGIDVQEKEPCDDLPLFSLDNFISTPHIAGLTSDALRRAGIQIAKECLEYLGVKTSEIHRFTINKGG